MMDTRTTVYKKVDDLVYSLKMKTSRYVEFMLSVSYAPMHVQIK